MTEVFQIEIYRQKVGDLGISVFPSFEEGDAIVAAPKLLADLCDVRKGRLMPHYALVLKDGVPIALFEARLGEVVRLERSLWPKEISG